MIRRLACLALATTALAACPSVPAPAPQTAPPPPVAVPVAPTVPVPPEPEEWDRPFAGVLPLPEDTRRLSVNREPPTLKLAPGGGCVIVSAETGEPIPGATLRAWHEDVDPFIIPPREPACSAIADAHGYAFAIPPGDRHVGHWVAEAPGYAPAHSFGWFPHGMQLRRGGDLRGRVLDWTGRPVPDAEIDMFIGCPHAPPVRIVRTGRDGVFVLRDVESRKGTFCVSARGVAYEQDGDGGSLGERPLDILLGPAPDVRGVVVEANGRPVPGAVLRGPGYPRGPATTTAADGTFLLRGLAAGSDLHLVLGRETTEIFVAEPFGAEPVTLRLDAARKDVEEFDEVESEDPPEAELQIRGAIPKDVGVVVALADGFVVPEGDPLTATIPADAPAFVHVAPNGAAGRVAWTFPVGAATDGVRVADVVIPAPHRIVFPPGADFEQLTHGPHKVALELDDGGLVTYAEGPVRLVLHNDDGLRSYDVTLSPEKREPIVLAASDGKPVAPAIVRVRFLPPPEVAEMLKVVITEDGGSTFTDDTSVESPVPCRITAKLPGFQPFDRTFVRAAEIEHRWGTARIHLALDDGDNGSAHSVISVDGICHWSRMAELELAGLTAGPHVIRVDPIDPAFEGRELRVVLAEGETRKRTLVLSKRAGK